LIIIITMYLSTLKCYLLMNTLKMKYVIEKAEYLSMKYDYRGTNVPA
jgi:hypothetical protein